MKDKKKVCAEIARRYQKADKTGRGKLLDEYTVTLGYNRDYPAHILSNVGKTRFVRVEGKPVKIIATPVVHHRRKASKTASSGRKQGRKPTYIREYSSRHCWRISGTCSTAYAENSWPLCSASCRTS
ncbi:MAG: hypothetical protein LBL28_03250 [Treponema sp.]|nr:hypothetical protein [Treponema sp.]